MGQQSKANIKPGAFIVLEGLDATGKSTQLRMFAEGKERGMFDHDLVLTHQPSGGNAVGNAVYAVTENATIHSPWARQYLHLASHAEHYETEIIPALDNMVPVIMDRCWWSTIAYGFYAGGLHETVPFDLFEQIATLPAGGWMPDIVFLFMDPFEDDYHNTPDLIQGYEALAEKSSCPVVRVEKGDKAQMFLSIIMALNEHDLIS